MLNLLKITKPVLGVAGAASLLAMGCNNPDETTADPVNMEGQKCAVTADCQQDSLLCFQETCHKICHDDENCRPDQKCDANLCLDVAYPECSANEDCLNKYIVSCLSPLNPTCRGGKCHYQPMTSETNCDDGNACTSGDKCDGEGNCVGTPLVCQKDSICDGNNYITYSGSCNELDDKGCVYTANSPLYSDNCEVEYLGKKDRGDICGKAEDCANNMLCVDGVCCTGAETLIESTCSDGVYTYYSCKGGTIKGNYEKIVRSCSEGCKPDQSACNGECSSHDDCQPGNYCDFDGSRKCIPQEENGFKVTNLADTRVCKSAVISVDGYCCDTLCDNSSTITCQGKCAAEIANYSCNTGICAPSNEAVFMEKGKICDSGRIVDVSVAYNCGYLIKNDSECLSKTYYLACDENSGTCRSGDDVTDAFVTSKKASENYYFANDNSSLQTSGYYFTICGGPYDLMQTTCNDSGQSQTIKKSCPYGCDPTKKICKDPT